MLRLKSIFSLIYKRYINLPKKIPHDFQILIQTSGMQRGVSDHYSLLIKRESKQSDYKLIQHDNDLSSCHKLSIDQVERLYKALRDSKAFRLNCSYEDLSVLGGSNSTLTIRANGRFKIINMRNSQPAQLKITFSIIQEFKFYTNLTQ